MGMGEVDASGNVNVSRLGGVPVGPGGFIDIAQNARKVVFCGTFEAKGARLACADGKLTIERHGEVCKFVDKVGQITFSGKNARRTGQKIVYVTERAVFRLTAEGVALEEVAPGVDLDRDVLERMSFRPVINGNPSVMPADYFSAELYPPNPCAMAGPAPLRLVLIGAGVIGARHVKSVAAEPCCRLTALADPAPAARAVSEAAGIVHYTDYEEMLDRERPEGAIVAAATPLHAPIGEACARRGIHMLMEKPVTDTVEAGRGLIAAAEQHRVRVLGGRPSIRLARYFLWIEMRAGDLLVRQRQGAGGRSGEANANTVQRRSSAPLGSFDELFGRPVLVAIHGRGCASSKCCASGIATPIRRAPSPPRETETRASRVPV